MGKRSAEKRLTQAYKNAKIEFFDNSSKYIFFSDCHRGDATPSDEFAKIKISIYLHWNIILETALPMWS